MRKRMIILVVSISLILSGSIGRIGYIIFGGDDYAESGNNSISVLIDSNEINLYYNDLTRLNNNVVEKYAVIRPVDKDIKEAYRLFKGEELKKIINGLKEGKPVVIKVDDDFASKSISTYFVRNNNYVCKQIINRESSGLLKHIPERRSELRVKYKVDANGRILSGDNGELISDNYYSNYGIKLTFDKDVEKAVYDASKELETGCVIVMDVKTSKILATVTKPDNSYINKPFEKYSVGSVFKIVTTLCALENNVNPNYNCTGKIKVGDSEYSCQEGKKHGGQNLKEALANSCNCYFVNLALKLGGKKLIDTAERLGFDENTEFCNGWTVKNAGYNKNKILSSKGETALFGFGQGSLTATPYQICNLLCTISNGGYKKQTRIIDEYIGEDNNISYIEKKVIASENAGTLMKYLKYVVENGTGKAADYNGKSAGKTATAQTGRYENGREILNTWFAGVYPYSTPKYAIVVMCDDGESGAKNCCPIFRTIVEMFDKM